MIYKNVFLLLITATLLISLSGLNYSENFPVRGRNTPGSLYCPEPPRIRADFNFNKDNNLSSENSGINDKNWLDEVKKNIQKEEYYFTNQDGKYQTINRQNNLKFKFYKNGFTAAPLYTKIPLFDENDLTLSESERKYKSTGDWDIELTIHNVERINNNNSLSPDDNSVNLSQINSAGDKASAESDIVRVEYTNDENGMRQDFIIKSKPFGSGRLALNLSASTNLKIIAGADALMFKDKKGNEQMKYSALKVWDANGRELRAYFEKTGNKNFRICVNDEDAVYPITIDPLSTSPNWVVNFGYSFGSASSAAGDVNGDGYGDVIVGAKENTTNYTNDGKVYLFLGSSTGLSLTPAWTAIGANQNSAFGHSISAAGDVNGDGYSDIIIGEPGYKAGSVSRGRAVLYYGSPSGLSANPDWTSIGTTTDFGRAVSTAGDVNGDGYSDVIVSTAYGTINSATNLGGAFLFLGSSSGLSASPVWEVNGTQYFENFGNSICTAGDINGDGYSDVIIGAPQYSVTSSSNEGKVYAYYGSSSGLSATANWEITGQQQGYKFGFAVYTAGDINGDGYSDVVIGAPDSAKAFVYNGSASGLSVSSSWSAAGSANSGFGYSVSTAGDFNGDGFSDIVVGAPGNTGQAFAYSGSPSGLSSNNVWSVSSDGSTGSLGFSVRIAGDVNGDGYSDVLVCGYSPKAFVFNGSPSGFTTSNSWTYNGLAGSFGWSVASAGDINGDGYSDVIVGAPDYNNGSFTVGRFFIFNGSSDGLSSSPSYMKTGSNSGTSIYRVGRCVASAGDVNGDGYSDIAVGISNGVFALNVYGGVEIYYGSASGLSSVPSWTKSSSVSQDEFGNSVATAGDINGDGFSDIIVGAWNLNTESGAAYAFYGSENGLSANADWSASGAYTSRYGYSVSSAGDVNGDGFSDVVVGAPLLSSFGGAYLYHGSSSGLSTSPNWQYTAYQPNGRFGISVACAGDVNGDGYSDVLIGQDKLFLYPIYAGAASCFYGSSSGLNPVYPEWFVEAPDPGFAHEFGGCVSSAGDVNGDGYSDVIVSAPYPFGDVYCYYGSSSGLPLSFNFNYNNLSTFRFGYSAASAGDVNGDGYSDIIIGAYFTNGGSAFLYNGNSSSGKSNFVQQYKPNTNGLLGTGNWTGADGQVKYGIFGRSPFGRADGKIIYEQKIRGTSFNPLTNTSGSGAGIFYQDLGLNGSIVNATSSGLNSAMEYKWRARVQYSPVNNPFQKLGPWRFYNSQFPLPFEGYKPKSVPIIPLIPAVALNFDGTNDYVVLPDALTSEITGGNAFTVEYWFKGSDVKSSVHLQNSNGYIISGYQGKFVISSDGGVNEGISLGNVNDGQWHHIAVTWERNQINGFRSYLDGAPVDQRNSADVSLPAITSGGKLGGSTDSGSYMNGSLDKVRFWNRAMSEDEVGYRSYCELRGVSYGLKAKYNFNQGISNHNNSGVTTLYDSSGNSYHGSLTNFALQGTVSNWTEFGPISSGFDCFPGLTLNLKVIPQGYYNSFGQLNIRDTMRAYLHSNVSPYNVIDSAISVIDSVSFEGIFNFVNSINGNYYISVRHRNTIETWSSYDETFNFYSPTYYFFIYGPYSAYGNNLTPVGSWFAIYSGDVNQDGVVDATDNGIIDNDAANFETGYRSADLNGDSIIDASDAALADNNAANFVSSVKP